MAEPGEPNVVEGPESAGRNHDTAPLLRKLPVSVSGMVIYIFFCIIRIK